MTQLRACTGQALRGRSGPEWKVRKLSEEKQTVNVNELTKNIVELKRAVEALAPETLTVRTWERFSSSTAR